VLNESNTAVKYSVVDPVPDPHGSLLVLVAWIRILDGKKWAKKYKKDEEISCFEVLDVSVLRVEGFSCSLD
jgi:hypothetical protein